MASTTIAASCLARNFAPGSAASAASQPAAPGWRSRWRFVNVPSTGSVGDVGGVEVAFLHAHVEQDQVARDDGAELSIQCRVVAWFRRRRSSRSRGRCPSSAPGGRRCPDPPLAELEHAVPPRTQSSKPSVVASTARPKLGELPRHQDQQPESTRASFRRRRACHRAGRRRGRPAGAPVLVPRDTSGEVVDVADLGRPRAVAISRPTALVHPQRRRTGRSRKNSSVSRPECGRRAPPSRRPDDQGVRSLVAEKQTWAVSGRKR